MFWVRYLLPPGVVYVTKLSNSFGLRLCPSRIKVFRLIIPLGLFSFLWESQFTVESGSLDLKFESDNDVNEIWEVVMACTMQYLEQCFKFCGTSTFREFIVCLGIMLIRKYFGEWEILLQQSQQFLITSFIREIMEAVYFIFCCFRRLSYVLLDFSFFSFLFELYWIT